MHMHRAGGLAFHFYVVHVIHVPVVQHYTIVLGSVRKAQPMKHTLCFISVAWARGYRQISVAYDPGYSCMISRVICHGYLPISLGHVANHHTSRLITANNQIT